MVKQNTNTIFLLLAILVTILTTVQSSLQSSLPCYAYLYRSSCPYNCKWSGITDTCDSGTLLTLEETMNTMQLFDENLDDLDQALSDCLLQQQLGSNRACIL